MEESTHKQMEHRLGNQYQDRLQIFIWIGLRINIYSNSNEFRDNIKIWKRSQDDIYILWNGGEEAKKTVSFGELIILTQEFNLQSKERTTESFHS